MLIDARAVPVLGAPVQSLSFQDVYAALEVSYMIIYLCTIPCNCSHVSSFKEQVAVQICVDELGWISALFERSKEDISEQASIRTYKV